MTGRLNVLILCEATGTIRETFARAGHWVTSVDTLPTTTPAGPAQEGPGASAHVVADALTFLAEAKAEGQAWDLIIARPPCTYLTNSGVRWLHERDENGILTRRAAKRWEHLGEAIAFFHAMQAAPAPFIAVENPVPHGYARDGFDDLPGIGRPTQTVQPYHFGHRETKRTGWWLTNLPALTPTDDVKAETMALPYAERAKVHYASPGPDRWAKRSALVQGMADAIVDQWGGYALGHLDMHSSASIQHWIETGQHLLHEGCAHDTDATN